jgi:DNA polymerase V
MATSGVPGSASGFPSPAEDYAEGRIDLHRELIASPLSTFVLRVRGDAMRGDGIVDGDLLVIDRSLQPQAGGMVVAVLEGRYIVRRLCFRPNRHHRLQLEASDGESGPIPLNDGQGGGADVWGVVIHAVHHLMAPGRADQERSAQDAGRRKDGAISPRRRNSR